MRGESRPGGPRVSVIVEGYNESLELVRSGARVVIHPRQRVAHDFDGRWWRFAGLSGIAKMRRLALYPLLLVASLLARGSETVAMHRTRLRPRKMEAFARTH